MKIQWEIHFLTYLNTDRNTPKKKFRIEIWTFSFQIYVKNQFSTSGSGQTENARNRVYVYFQFDHFPKAKICESIVKTDIIQNCLNLSQDPGETRQILPSPTP